MRVYIMTDLEGVCGVLDSGELVRVDFPLLRTGQGAADPGGECAVEGFVAGGAPRSSWRTGMAGAGSTRAAPPVRGTGAQLARGQGVSLLHGCARVRCGGLDRAAPESGNSRRPPLSHWQLRVRDLSINGVSVGEFGELVLCAGELGVRVILAAGCEAFTREAATSCRGSRRWRSSAGRRRSPGTTCRRRPTSGTTRRRSPQPGRSALPIRAGAQKAIQRARSEDFGLVTLKPPSNASPCFAARTFIPARATRRAPAERDRAAQPGLGFSRAP